MTHKFAGVKHLGKHYTQLKTSRRINEIRDTENTDHGLDMDFYGLLVNQSE